MAHSHLGCQSPRDYFTEQLLTILVCGALGFVGIQMYRTDMLRHILAPQFHGPVLYGSIAVLVLVVVRAITVWREAGSLLKELWELGQKPNADELLKDVTGAAVELEAVAEHVRSAIPTPAG